jgi:hypothetical protein
MRIPLCSREVYGFDLWHYVDSGASNELTKWVHSAFLVGKQQCDGFVRFGLLGHRRWYREFVPKYRYGTTILRCVKSHKISYFIRAVWLFYVSKDCLVLNYGYNTGFQGFDSGSSVL